MVIDSVKQAETPRGVAGRTATPCPMMASRKNHDGGAELPQTGAELEKIMLNGAKDWSAYSWGGSSLIYDEDISKTLCTPSELKKTRNGERRPNSREEWLDTQARALYQAAQRVKRAARA